MCVYWVSECVPPPTHSFSPPPRRSLLGYYKLAFLESQSVRVPISTGLEFHWLIVARNGPLRAGHTMYELFGIDMPRKIFVC